MESALRGDELENPLQEEHGTRAASHEEQRRQGFDRGYSGFCQPADSSGFSRLREFKCSFCQYTGARLLDLPNNQASLRKVKRWVCPKAVPVVTLDGPFTPVVGGMSIATAIVSSNGGRPLTGLSGR
jgi:hypothetical protein